MTVKFTLEFEKLIKMLKITRFTGENDVVFTLAPDSLRVFGVNKSHTVAVLCDLVVAGSTAEGQFAVSGDVAEKMAKKRGTGNAVVSFDREIKIKVGGDTYKISTVDFDPEFVKGMTEGLFTENMKKVAVTLLCGVQHLKQKLENLDIGKYEAVPLDFDGKNLVVGSVMGAGLLSYIGKTDVKVLTGENEKVKFNYGYSFLMDALDRIGQFSEEVYLMFTKDGLMFMMGYIGTKSKVMIVVAPRVEVEGMSAEEGEKE